ncbi:ABC transporter permease [uncultured Methylovirgula sp.]|uniref:ABC transporter permease n=1 Tax=uncultured Methylovirgula sp. TaxID=1285960 RepID=UPI00260A92F7|nr:ABC transporter permease [uncultured Methylovirgula sp.]
MKALRRAVPPVLAFLGFLLVWEAIVRHGHIPPYILPAPSCIGATLIADRATLLPALWVTLSITLEGLLAATFGGVVIAILFTQWRWLERAFLPFAVILQVTPIIAIAPLLLIYCTPPVAVLLCAFLVAFFPILANTALGLASAGRNLSDLFALYGATPGQTLWLLKMPAALPLFLAGLRIGGGLALIGAIAAELTAGTQGGRTGLAFRIVEAGYRLNIPRMFAALALVALTGIAIYVALAALSRWALRRWHESAAETG